MIKGILFKEFYGLYKKIFYCIKTPHINVKLNIKISDTMRKCIGIICVILITGSTIFAQTSGILKVTVTTKATGLAGRNYAPRNSMAIWIEDQSGIFIKTLLVNAQQRRMQLRRWETATNTAGYKYNAVDAVTGATNITHGTRTCSWNGTDLNGKVLPDGNYNIMMELTDIDGAGNIYAVPFNKNSKNVSFTPPDNSSFYAIKIEWEPSAGGK
jgi:hypothetical protein